MIFAVAASVIIIDLLTKYYVSSWLFTLPNRNYTLIDGVLSLTYNTNEGAAFGILGGYKWIFVAASVLALIAIAYFYISNKKNMTAFISVSLGLIAGGAIGNNLIDRLFIGHVRDFIYFRLINFPVFNVADIGITVGAILLGIYLLFTKRGQELFKSL